MSAFRVLALVILAGSMLAVVIALDGPSAPQVAAPPVGADRGDSLAAALRRCQALGPAAQDDAACREAWRRNRERFFGASPSRPDHPVDPAPHSLRPPVPLPPRDPPPAPE